MSTKARRTVPMSNMFPSSWGNYGGHQPQNFGGPAPRKQHPAGQGAAPAAGFGAAPAGGSALFSSLQEQHLQQMQIGRASCRERVYVLV